LSRKNFFLLTAFGKDRPGIVAGVAKVLFEFGANVEDASMTRLGGEFTMMLVTSLPASVSAAKLEKGLAVLQKKLDIQASAKSIPAAIGAQVKNEPPKFMISVYGADRPGIVYRVTEALAKRKVSITDLQTKVTGGASPIYVMLLEVQVPASLDMDDLRSELDDLRRDLQVEISLQDIEAIPL
jgi:glycine cleavage system transcriptional repressor